MWKTLSGLFVSLLLLVGLSIYEIRYVTTAMDRIRDAAIGLFHLTEERCATHEDGNALRLLWEAEKETLHIWVPHTSIENIDYHLNEALGYLYQENYEDALPKLEVIIDMTETITHSIALLPGNVF
ncbi:MAG: DUF4363 family protein [Clostridia bacterium]|nr:DUF4363 family protein [Clostridia bacterium]